MRIVGYNIRKGGNGREEMTAEVLQSIGADVVIIVEATDPQVVESIAEKIGFDYFASREKSSVAFVSRIEPTAYQWHERPNIRAPFLEIKFSETFCILGIHLTALLTLGRERQRLYEVEQLIDVASRLSEKKHILIGDFNAIAPDDKPEIKRMPFWLRLVIGLSGGISHLALQKLISVGYVDVFRNFHPDDVGYTLPPPQPNTRLDYVFAYPTLMDAITNCQVIRTPIAVNSASDHYPILVDIEIP